MNDNVAEGLGCALAAAGVAIALTLLVWALTGFPRTALTNKVKGGS